MMSALRDWMMSLLEGREDSQGESSQSESSQSKGSRGLRSRLKKRVDKEKSKAQGVRELRSELAAASSEMQALKSEIRTLQQKTDRLRRDQTELSKQQKDLMGGVKTLAATLEKAEIEQLTKLTGEEETNDLQATLVAGAAAVGMVLGSLLTALIL
jgi:soluble cytochrome b562